MSFKTRPYIAFGLGSNPLKSYRIENKEASISAVAGMDGTLPLTSNGVNVEIDRGKLPRSWARAVLGLGNVTVSNPNGSLLFEKVINTSAFKRAVELEASLPTVAERDAQEQERIRKAPLSNVLVYFPQIPKSVERLLQANGRGTGYIQMVTEGDYVKKGQIIGNFGDTDITAPVDGRIEMLGYPSACDYEWNYGSYIRDYIQIEKKSATAALASRSDNPEMLVFGKPDISDPKAKYSFGIRPLADVDDKDFLRLRYAFDNGKGIDDKGKSLYKLVYSYWSGKQFPPSLQNDEKLKAEIIYGFWPMIDSGKTVIENRPLRFTPKPEDPSYP